MTSPTWPSRRACRPFAIFGGFAGNRSASSSPGSNGFTSGKFKTPRAPDPQPSFGNLLRVQDQRDYRMMLSKSGGLRLFADSGDELLLAGPASPGTAETVAADGDEHPKVGTAPTPGIPDSGTNEFAGENLPPIPAELLPEPFRGARLPLDHKPGEIARFRPYLPRPKFSPDRGTTQVAFDLSGTRALSILSGSEIMLHDLTSGKTITRIEAKLGKAVASPDLSVVADVGLRLYDVATGRQLKSLKFPEVPGRPGQVNCLAFAGATSAPLLLAGSDNGNFLSWDRAGAARRLANVGRGKVTAVALSADGQTAFAASEEYEHKLAVISASDGKVRQTLAGWLRRIKGIVPAPDGRHVLVIMEGAAKHGSALDARLELAIRPLVGGPLKWNAIVPGRPNCFAISADWRRLVVGDADGPVRVWDLPSGRELPRLLGHQQIGSESVTSVAVSPDGRFALSGGQDVWMILWGLQE